MIATIAAVLAVFVLTDRPAFAASQANVYGAVSAMNAFSLSKLPASQWDPQLAAMSADGVQLVRSDADWGTIEPDAPGAAGPVWQFGSTDAWVAALATHGLTWQPILDYDNSWATAVGDHADFAAFAQAVVQRYGVGGSFWAEQSGAARRAGADRRALERGERTAVVHQPRGLRAPVRGDPGRDSRSR